MCAFKIEFFFDKLINKWLRIFSQKEIRLVEILKAEIFILIIRKMKLKILRALKSISIVNWKEWSTILILEVINKASF